MFMTLMFFLLSMFISMFLFYFSKLILFKSFNNFEKMNSYECGFELISSTRNPFSIKFFIIGIIFLVFDMEIIILLSLIFYFFNYNLAFFSNFLFFLILTLGFFYEWNMKSLDWF